MKKGGFSMVDKKDKPFNGLAVGEGIDSPRTSMFSTDDNPGSWIDPSDDAIVWHELSVYGIPDMSDDEVLAGDYSSAIEIGTVMGCHVACSLILNLGADPYVACDDADANLEAMYSIIQEHENDFIDHLDDIFYIHEIELKPEYQGFGYERTILLQLPAIIVRALHVFPSLIMYFPSPTQHDETGLDEETEALIRHRLNYRLQKINKKTNDGNLVLFPPKQDIPEKAINYVLGRRIPGSIVTETYRNHDIYDLYKSAGFSEVGKTGWLCKTIANVYSDDGLNY